VDAAEQPGLGELLEVATHRVRGDPKSAGELNSHQLALTGELLEDHLPSLSRQHPHIEASSRTIPQEAA
jgi:hypothetical protein